MQQKLQSCFREATDSQLIIPISSPQKDGLESLRPIQIDRSNTGEFEDQMNEIGQEEGANFGIRSKSTRFSVIKTKNSTPKQKSKSQESENKNPEDAHEDEFNFEEDLTVAVSKR
jgi:hypothetical protein